MAEHQSPLRSQDNMGHVKQPHGTGMGEHSPHSPVPGINAKSHPGSGRRAHIHSYKEHGHGGHSSHQFPGARDMHGRHGK